MAWFEDLSPCTYFSSMHVEPTDLDKMLAVGWLEGDHTFSKGDVAVSFRQKLRELLKDAWQSGPSSAGGHSCSICSPQGDSRAYGSRELFIPGNSTVYVAPELISHYIDDHSYAPPAVFIEAALSCPAMGSKAYFEALSRSGPPSLAANAKLAMSQTCIPRDAPQSLRIRLQGFRLMLIGLAIITVSSFVMMLLFMRR